MWQVTLTRGMVATFISSQHLHATYQCEANISQVNQSWETKGLVMLLPLTRRLFSSSHRGLVVEKKISDKKNCKTETQLMLLTLTKRFMVAMAI